MQVFLESLRLYPTAHGTARQTTEELQLSGYNIPKGSEMIFPSFAIQIVFIETLTTGKNQRSLTHASTFDSDRQKVSNNYYGSL